MKGGNGIGFGTVLFVVFLVLKLTGVITLVLAVGVRAAVDPARDPARRAATRARARWPAERLEEMSQQRPIQVRQSEAGPNAKNTLRAVVERIRQE